MTDLLPATSDQSDPLIIAQQNHPIRPKMVDSDAALVMRKLNKAGFSSYLVGGGVRDLYLGKTPKDFDISTDARPGQIRKLFPNSSTIGRRFRLVQVFFKSGKVIEVSTLRSLSEHDLDGPEAVLAPNNTYGSLAEDAQRRDLTINSLFYELENHTLIDYIGGVDDLDRSIIRMIGTPDKRINRDPVRMLRAIRHSARTGFSIEQQTWQSICNNHRKLTLCPSSRIRDELFKDIYGGSVSRWFELAVESDLFFAIFPFYRKIIYTSLPQRPSCYEQLHSIFSIIDNFASRAERKVMNTLPKYFSLALILLPWADVRFNLSKRQLKGPAAFQLSKLLRKEIDNLLGTQLNLRRSLRQEMVTLLSNLPQFVRFVQNGTCPKWLKKKSYYAKCHLFYDIYNAVVSGQKNSNSLPQLFDSMSRNSSQHSQKRQNSKRKTKPAFSPKKKGGVFGFRK